MDWFVRLVKSSIGKKALMGLSGAALLGFVIVHMAGNLLVFAGPEALNEYAKGLHDLGPVLWAMRLGLLGAVLTHIAVAFALFSENQQARPVKYQHPATIKASPQSRTMIVSGFLLLLFIVYHLLQLTFGVIDGDTHAANPAALYDLKGEMVPNVYHMVVSAFTQPLVTILYIVSMLLLGAHLSHGIASMFQSLGLSNPRYRPLIKKLGWGLSALLVTGNIAMPLCVLLGIIGGAPAGA